MKRASPKRRDGLVAATGFALAFLLDVRNCWSGAVTRGHTQNDPTGRNLRRAPSDTGIHER